jgi:hypothetical protein
MLRLLQKVIAQPFLWYYARRNAMNNGLRHFLFAATMLAVLVATVAAAQLR